MGNPNHDELGRFAEGSGGGGGKGISKAALAGARSQIGEGRILAQTVFQTDRTSDLSLRKKVLAGRKKHAELSTYDGARKHAKRKATMKAKDEALRAQQAVDVKRGNEQARHNVRKRLPLYSPE